MAIPRAIALVCSCSFVLGCSANVGSGGGKKPGGSGSGGMSVSTGSGTGGAGGDGSGDPNNPTGDPVMPFEANSVYTAVRKVKNLTTGLAPTADEVNAVSSASDKVAAFKTLLDTWMARPEFQAKMVGFFRNTFQQTGFVPTEDFKRQLLENGGFDLGPLGIYGDDAFPRLVQNLQDSFALTAWSMVDSGQPFTNVLTTNQYMMTTALKSLYLMIEMPNDQPYAFGAGGKTCKLDSDCGGAPMGCNTGLFTGRVGGTSGTCQLAWKIDMSKIDATSGTIPLEDTLDPSSPNYMVFDDQCSSAGCSTTAIGGGMGFVACQGTGMDPPNPSSGALPPGPVRQYYGYSVLFQRLFGFTQRWPYVGAGACLEHMSKPYYSTSDLTDWQMVTVRAKGANEAYIQPYDLPTLRKTTTLPLAMPRVGFYTTPAYLALWNTNDSNQHRVTANQTLLVALGKAFTAADAIVPTSTVGLDTAHTTTTGDCYGCHKGLDPLRQFWANQFDYNDRNDFPARAFNGGAANPRPSMTGGALAFDQVNTTGASMNDLGNLIASDVDMNVDAPGMNVNRFAMSMAQKLCYFADSASCVELDPEFRRVASAFEKSSFAWKTLVRELFSSPLVTGLATTKTFDARNVVVSIARRDQLCAALSNRLGITDICAQAVAFPSQGFGRPATGGTTNMYAAEQATLLLAGSVPADAFSRGSEAPVTPADPTLFFRAGSELLCENIAGQVVDVTGAPFQSSDATGAMTKMVELVMGYAPGDPHHDDALTILQNHYNEARTATGAGTGATAATNALRSTFALACQSPTSLSFGI